MSQKKGVASLIKSKDDDAGGLRDSADSGLLKVLKPTSKNMRSDAI